MTVWNDCVHILTYCRMIVVQKQVNALYTLDQTPLPIYHHSRVVAAPPDVLNKILVALKY